MAVNLRQLEYFVAIVEHGSFTGAAEHLLVSQPSLSQQIARSSVSSAGRSSSACRAASGSPLRARGCSARRGRRCATRERARRGPPMALALDAGQLEVAAATSAASGSCPWCCATGSDVTPAIEVSLLEYPHRRGLDEAVRDGAGDIARRVAARELAGPVERLGWEEFVVVLPDGDPLLDAPVGRPGAAWPTGAGCTSRTAHGLAEVLDFCCARAGFTPRVAVRTSQVTAAPLFAAAGIGPALVPSHIVPAALAGSRVRPRRARCGRCARSRAGIGRRSPTRFSARCASSRGAPSHDARSSWAEFAAGSPARDPCVSRRATG